LPIARIVLASGAGMPGEMGRGPWLKNWRLQEHGAIAIPKPTHILALKYSSLRGVASDRVVDSEPHG
jgi:hypothetical protein